MNQRVVIVGRPGTGKTTLAIDLAANWEGDWVWVDTIREFAKWDKKKLLERFEQDKIKKIWKLEQLESRLTNFFMDQARKFILRTPRRIIFFPLAGTDKLLQRQLSFLLSLLKKRSKKFKNDMLLIHYFSGSEPTRGFSSTVSCTDSSIFSSSEEEGGITTRGEVFKTCPACA